MFVLIKLICLLLRKTSHAVEYQGRTMIPVTLVLDHYGIQGYTINLIASLERGVTDLYQDLVYLWIGVC